MPKRKRLNVVSTSNISNEQQGNENAEHWQHPNGTAPSERSLTTVSAGYQSTQTSEAQPSQPSTSLDLQSSGSVVVKKGRGPTMKLEIWQMAPGKKIVVTFNEFVQPIGDEGKALIDFLGTLVRIPNHIGINYADWRQVSNTTKESLWEIVKEKFVFLPVETPEIKKWVIEDMASKLKSWKNEIKDKNFDPALTVEEMVENADDERINKDQLKELVTMWMKPEFQELCAQKKASRSNNKEPHVTGSKSFARLVEEEKIKNNGVRPTSGQVYVRTRTRKDGSIVNASAATVVDAINNVMSESDGTQEFGNDWRDDDLTKVKGPEKRGRIRCLGKTVSSKAARAVSSEDTNVRIEGLEAKLAKLTTNFNMFLSAVKQHMSPEQLTAILDNMSNEVGDDHSPSNRRSSNRSTHQPENSTN